MTLHRALGYVDRAAVRDGEPLRVVMCSEGMQADGIDLRMSGARLDRYRSNPVLGYGHSYWGRGNLPIGRAMPDTIRVDGSRILGDLDFDAGDEFAREVERKMRAGFLSAVSIGFDVLEFEGGKGDMWRGGVAVDWELHELSVVPVPMDASAVVESGRSADPELARLLRALLERLEPPPAVEVPQDPTSADPAGVVSTAARDDLLAAFRLCGENA
jgi:HK97 family phage prohead protease